MKSIFRILRKENQGVNAVSNGIIFSPPKIRKMSESLGTPNANPTQCGFFSHSQKLYFVSTKLLVKSINSLENYSLCRCFRYGKCLIYIYNIQEKIAQYMLNATPICLQLSLRDIKSYVITKMCLHPHILTCLLISSKFPKYVTIY